MTRDLFVQAGLSAGLRRGAAALVHGRLVDQGYRVSTKLAMGRLRVRVVLSRWWWLLLGARHLAVWLRARSIVRRALRDIAVPIVYHVTVTSQAKGKANGRSKVQRTGADEPRGPHRS